MGWEKGRGCTDAPFFLEWRIKGVVTDQVFCREEEQRREGRNVIVRLLFFFSVDVSRVGLTH